MTPSSRILVAPSILSCDFARIADEIATIERAGADLVHVDVMDGHFVPNLTLGPPIVSAIRKATKLPLDVHLMIQEPDKFLGAFADAGSDYLSVHVEALPHLQRTLSAIRKLGVKAGAALNPATPPDVLEWVVGDLDFVLVMTVNPGFGGQAYLGAVAPKVGAVASLLRARNPGALIEVDGGITDRTAPEVVRQGARMLVAGSYVFGAKDRKKAIDDLRSASQAALVRET